MKNWRLRYILLFVLAAKAQAQFVVTDSGTPAYTQAIVAPPGVAGMSPKIALAYSAGGVNGPVGVGWSVQGVSLITRCGAIRAIDGTKGGVSFGPADKLCLDGQRLIQTNPDGLVANGTVQNPGPTTAFQTGDSAGVSPSSAPREFRTEKDSYARIRAYGYANNDSSGTSGPAYFRVWTKSGQIYEYGAGPASDTNSKALINATGSQVATVWAVSRISDTLGNFIDFKYAQRAVSWGTINVAGSSAGSEWNLSEIQYGGNKIIFSYIDRPDTPNSAQDRSEAWHLGSKNISVRLLQSITTYVNASPNALGSAGALPTKTYLINYKNSPVTGRSLVASLSECLGGAVINGTNNNCLPASQFSYTQATTESYQASANFDGGPLATLAMTDAGGSYGVVAADFDGDGKTDILRWSNNPAENQLWLSQGDGNFRLVPNGTGSGQFNLNTVYLFSNDSCFSSTVADFDGDGIPDILRTVQPTSNGGVACASYPNQLFIGNGDGSFKAPINLTGIDLSTAQEVISSTTIKNCVLALFPIRDGDHLAANTVGTTNCYQSSKSPGKSFYVLDVNGDGILDIVTTLSPSWYYNTQLGDTKPLPDDKCVSSICTHVYLGNSSGGVFSFKELTTTNLAHHTVYADPVPGTPMSAVFKPNTVDVDGDGLADLSTKYGGWHSNGDGNFTPITGANLYCSMPIDFNGDGSPDCLFPGGYLPASISATNNSIFVSDGGAHLTQVPNFNLNQAGQSDLATPTGGKTAYGVVVLDVNLDGRGDILRWSDDPSQNQLFLSNGDGTFRVSTTFNIKGANSAATDLQLKKSDGSYDFAVGDFTGNGNVEILRMAAAHSSSSTGLSNRLFVKGDQTLPDLLYDVRTGTGAETRVEYVSLANPIASNLSYGSPSIRYVQDKNPPNPADFPQVNITPASYVVATSWADNGLGVGPAIPTDYSYSGLKFDRNGRGSLGFRQISKTSSGTDGTLLTTTTQYLQTSPYIGSIGRSDTISGNLFGIGNVPVLSSTINVYCDLTIDSSVASTAVSAAQSNSGSGYGCPTSAFVQRPYLLFSRQIGYDLSGAALPSVSSAFSYQPSGDPAVATITTTAVVNGAQQSVVKTTTNKYFADMTSGDSWVLGRLSQATVSNTVTTPLLPTSAGSSPNASSTKGTAPLPAPAPLSAAQLMPILQMLLLND